MTGVTKTRGILTGGAIDRGGAIDLDPILRLDTVTELLGVARKTRNKDVADKSPDALVQFAGA